MFLAAILITVLAVFCYDVLCMRIVYLPCPNLQAICNLYSGCYHQIDTGGFMSDRDSGNSFLWFLAGLGIGAAVGVLYAPRSGSETREALRARADEGREYMRDRAKQAREQASEWVDKGREVVNQQKDQFRSAYEAGRQAYQDTTKETAKNL
jgi:gas vesicle protein